MCVYKAVGLHGYQSRNHNRRRNVTLDYCCVCVCVRDVLIGQPEVSVFIFVNSSGLESRS